jgi:hypothetical protein
VSTAQLAPRVAGIIAQRGETAEITFARLTGWTVKVGNSRPTSWRSLQAASSRSRATRTRPRRCGSSSGSRRTPRPTRRPAEGDLRQHQVRPGHAVARDGADGVGRAERHRQDAGQPGRRATTCAGQMQARMAAREAAGVIQPGWSVSDATRPAPSPTDTSSRCSTRSRSARPSADPQHRRRSARHRRAEGARAWPASQRHSVASAACTAPPGATTCSSRRPSPSPGNVEINRIEVPLVGQTKTGYKPGRETREGTLTIQKIDARWELEIFKFLNASLAASPGRSRHAERDAPHVRPQDRAGRSRGRLRGVAARERARSGGCRSASRSPTTSSAASSRSLGVRAPAVGVRLQRAGRRRSVRRGVARRPGRARGLREGRPRAEEGDLREGSHGQKDLLAEISARGPAHTGGGAAGEALRLYGVASRDALLRPALVVLPAWDS